MNEKILISVIFVFFLTFVQSVFSIPPHPIKTTSITPPSSSGNSQKVLEINFSITKTNQITLQNIAIKNLPEVAINTANSDYYFEITDSNNKILFQSNILVIFDPNTNLSQQYYAIPYPSGAKYLYFFYQGNQIAKYDVPQEFPWFYVIIGIIIVIILIAVYFISRKYTIQI